MTQPFFSILVPVYNVREYLEECLENLANQSFPDYEVVLVDDGSTDGSEGMCDAWQERFPERVRVIHQENRGLVLARSVGFQTARGRYFVIVDSDDVLHTDALRILHEYLTRYDADMVLYRASKKRDFSEPIREAHFQDGELLSISTSPELKRLMGSTFEMNSLWTKAFRREIADTDRDFSAVSHISEGDDLMFSLPVVERAERIVFCDRILYYYRVNPASVTNTFKPSLFRSVRDTLRIQRSYAEKWDSTLAMAEECDRNALRRFYDVIARIGLTSLPKREKRRYMLEVVTDSDFCRCYAHLSKMDERKVRLTLMLAKNRCFEPLFLYGWMKRNCILTAVQDTEFT